MTPNILDVKPIVAYLETLVNLPSPTGYTAQVEQFLISNAQQKQIPYEQTRKGAVIYRFAAPSSRPGVMFAAHVDTLGAIVKDVSNDAVTLSPIGKSPVVYLIGDYCQIHAFDGTVYEGTILPN
ncbi:hypothetical protein GF339_18900, partial [candidate division KSB3 bacterium]|nr:hypothetical protein [candidate division KSB3 bacterium]MBD3326660.1 hypothetical protein [candidate division KSB3 bacterium]